jgi:hypothetical protein
MRHRFHTLCRALTIVAGVFATSAVLAQGSSSGIRRVSSERVSVAFPHFPHWESHIAVDPRDPKHIVATSNFQKGPHGAMVYATFDGGKRWQPSNLTEPRKDVTHFGDPTVYFAVNGDVLFVNAAATRTGLGLTVSRSIDGGRSFGRAKIYSYRDRDWLAIDTISPSFRGYMYLVGNHTGISWDNQYSLSPGINRSVDDGRTFGPMDLLVQDLGGDKTQTINGSPQQPVITTDGVLLVPIWSGQNGGMWRLLVSNDAGKNFSDVRDGPALRHEVPDSGWVSHQNHPMAPSAAIDHSNGPYRNRVYIAWADYASDGASIKLGSTSDFGKTWQVVRVTDDTTPGRDPATATVAVNKNGVVAVSWLDRRDDSKGVCWHLYAAISLDGGAHFLPNKRLSDKQTCVTTPGNWTMGAYGFNTTREEDGKPVFQLSLQPSVILSKQGGDTQGLQADRDGTFHSAWINGETGTLQLWHTAFSVDPVVLPNRDETAATDASRSESADGRTDVTQSIAVQASDIKIDFEKRQLNFTVRVKNTSSRSLPGSLELVFAGLAGPPYYGKLGLEQLTVRGKPLSDAAGTSWLLSSTGATLPPGGTTQPLTITFGFSGGIPEKPNAALTPQFRVLSTKVLKR